MNRPASSRCAVAEADSVNLSVSQWLRTPLSPVISLNSRDRYPAGALPADHRRSSFARSNRSSCRWVLVNAPAWRLLLAAHDRRRDPFAISNPDNGESRRKPCRCSGWWRAEAAQGALCFRSKQRIHGFAQANIGSAATLEVADKLTRKPVDLGALQLVKLAPVEVVNGIVSHHADIGAGAVEDPSVDRPLFPNCHAGLLPLFD